MGLIKRILKENSTGQIIIKQYDDGYYWVDSLDVTEYTIADTNLLLIDKTGGVQVVVAYHYGAKLFTKLVNSDGGKPDEKYHPYILDLFVWKNEVRIEDINITREYQLTRCSYQNDPKDNFHLLDLNDNLFNEAMTNIDDEIIKRLFFCSLKIDYAQLAHKLDHEHIDTIRSKKLLTLLAKHAGNRGAIDRRIIALNEEDKFIDLLISNDLLDEKHKSLKYYATTAKYSGSRNAEVKKLIQAIIDKEKLYTIHIPWHAYVFYKK